MTTERVPPEQTMSPLPPEEQIRQATERRIAVGTVDLPISKPSLPPRDVLYQTMLRRSEQIKNVQDEDGTPWEHQDHSGKTLQEMANEMHERLYGKPSPPKTFAELDAALQSWHRRKYGDRPIDVQRTFNKVVEEVGEIGKGLNKGDTANVIEECADVAITLVHLCRAHGANLFDAMVAKLAVIEERLRQKGK